MASSPIPLPKNPFCCFCERMIPTCDCKGPEVTATDKVICRLCQWDAQTSAVRKRWVLQKAAGSISKDSIQLRTFKENPYNLLPDPYLHDIYGLVLSAYFIWDPPKPPSASNPSASLTTAVTAANHSN